MPIRRLLEGSGLGPDEVENLCRAYDDALHALHLVDRNDPIAEMLARTVIQIGRAAAIRPTLRGALSRLSISDRRIAPGNRT